MKNIVKYSLPAQAIFLFAVVVAGAVLLGDKNADAVRLAHRLFGSLGIVFAATTAIAVTRRKANLRLKVAAWAVVTLGGIAGVSGASLKTTSDYSMALMTMRISGSLAFLVSAAILVRYIAAQRKNRSA